MMHVFRNFSCLLSHNKKAGNRIIARTVNAIGKGFTKARGVSATILPSTSAQQSDRNCGEGGRGNTLTHRRTSPTKSTQVPPQSNRPSPKNLETQPSRQIPPCLWATPTTPLPKPPDSPPQNNKK